MTLGFPCGSLRVPAGPILLTHPLGVTQKQERAKGWDSNFWRFAHKRIWVRFHYLVARHEDWSSGFEKSHGFPVKHAEFHFFQGDGKWPRNGQRSASVAAFQKFYNAIQAVGCWPKMVTGDRLPGGSAESVPPPKGVLVWHANAIWSCQHSQSSHRSSNVLRHLFCYDTCIAYKRLENRWYRCKYCSSWHCVIPVYVYACLVFASLVWIEYPQIFERFFGCGWPNPIFHMGMVCHRIGAILCFFLIGKPTGSDDIYVFIQLVF